MYQENANYEEKDLIELEEYIDEEYNVIMSGITKEETTKTKEEIIKIL